MPHHDPILVIVATLTGFSVFMLASIAAGALADWLESLSREDRL